MIRFGIFHKFYFMETYNGKHLHMRSGMERLTYALIIVLVATMSAWIMAMLLHLQPVDFIKIRMSAAMWILTRLAASFFGVFGFMAYLLPLILFFMVAFLISNRNNPLPG